MNINTNFPININNQPPLADLLSKQSPIRLCDVEIQNMIDKDNNFQLTKPFNTEIINAFEKSVNRALINCKNKYDSENKKINQCIDTRCYSLAQKHCENEPESCFLYFLKNVCCQNNLL